MSITRTQSFNVVLRLLEANGVDLERVSLKGLRAVVAGHDRSLPRDVAMTLLVASDLPTRHRDLKAVLSDEQESPAMRYLAAINLGRVGTPEAVEALIRSSNTRDEAALEGIITALGYIGGISALEVISEFKRHGAKFVAARAEFAAALISHRLGLDGNDLPVYDRESYLAILGAARPFRITAAGAAAAELCLRSLADQPFGVEFAERPMYQIRCERNALMIVFNRVLIGGEAIQMLRERKTLWGVIARRSEQTGLYSAGHLILSSPAKEGDEINVLIHRLKGESAYAGTARVEGDRAWFTIGTISQPGAVAVMIEGSYRQGRLDITTSQSATYSLKKREPIRTRKKYTKRDIKAGSRI